MNKVANMIQIDQKFKLKTKISYPIINITIQKIYDKIYKYLHKFNDLDNLIIY